MEDICDVEKPDERSVMTYVAQYFHAFNELNTIGGAEIQVAKFVEILINLKIFKTDYETKVRKIYNLTDQTLQFFAEFDFQNVLASVNKLSAYESDIKSLLFELKHEIYLLFQKIQIICNMNGLAPYIPPTGMQVKDVSEKYKTLITEEQDFRTLLKDSILNAKSNVEKKQQSLYKQYVCLLKQTSHCFRTLNSDLNKQLQETDSVQINIDNSSSLIKEMKDLQDLEKQYHICVHPIDSQNIITETNALRRLLGEKRKFIEVQMSNKSLSLDIENKKLTEYMSLFDDFDTDNDNKLTITQLNILLASIGHITEEEEIKEIFNMLYKNNPDPDHATKEQFKDFILKLEEDSFNCQQVLESFNIVALNKSHLTKDNILNSRLPKNIQEYLLENIDKDEIFNYTGFVTSAFNK